MKTSPQELFNRVSTSLRANGNPYGSVYARGWSYVNPCNPNDRCALARLVDGNTNEEVKIALQRLFGQTPENYKTCDELSFSYALANEYAVCRSIMDLFDHNSFICNSKVLLENALQEIADKYSLEYTTNTVAKNVAQEFELV